MCVCLCVFVRVAWGSVDSSGHLHWTRYAAWRGMQLHTRALHANKGPTLCSKSAASRKGPLKAWNEPPHTHLSAQLPITQTKPPIPWKTERIAAEKRKISGSVPLSGSVPKLYWFFLGPCLILPTNIRRHQFSSFCVILRTDKQTNKQKNVTSLVELLTPKLTLTNNIGWQNPFEELLHTLYLI